MRTLSCSIDMIHTPQEDAWMISVPCESAGDAALAFAAMHLGRTDRIVFADGNDQLIVRPDSVTLAARTIPVNKTWLESIWCLFLDCHHSGWSDTAHIDQQFHDSEGSIFLTIEISYIR